MDYLQKLKTELLLLTLYSWKETRESMYKLPRIKRLEAYAGYQSASDAEISKIIQGHRQRVYDIILNPFVRRKSKLINEVCNLEISDMRKSIIIMSHMGLTVGQIADVLASSKQSVSTLMSKIKTMILRENVSRVSACVCKSLQQ